MEKNERATKKQRELLAFIDAFIKGNNYGPSYREIMRALGYRSVSTVAIHVDGLIAKGYLRKRDNSARSIEVIKQDDAAAESPHVKWLIDAMNARLLTGTNSGEREAFEQTLKALSLPTNRLQDEQSDKSISDV